MAETVQPGGEAEKSASGSLESVALLVGEAAGGASRLPPVHLWNPPSCGDIGLRIASDGTWYYQNSPILRPELVRLFSTILRRDPDRYVLVTPVEMVVVEVEDAPFLAVEMAVERGPGGRVLNFRTNVGDRVTADRHHRLRFETGTSSGLKPYLDVRQGLRALVSRPLLYELVELGETRDMDGQLMYGVASAGEFFVMAPAAEIEGME